MPELADDTILTFLAAVGRRHPHPARLLLLGGSALCLLGSPRPTLDIDYVGDDTTKIDRGFDTDIDDIVFLIRRDFAQLETLEPVVQYAATRSSEFGLSQREMFDHLQAVRNLL